MLQNTPPLLQLVLDHCFDHPKALKGVQRDFAPYYVQVWDDWGIVGDAFSFSFVLVFSQKADHLPPLNKRDEKRLEKKGEKKKLNFTFFFSSAIYFLR